MNHTLHRFLAICALAVLLAVPAVGFAQKDPAPSDPGATVTDPKGGTTQPLPGQPTTAQAQGDNNFVPLTQLPGLEQAAESGDFAGLLNNLYLLCVGAGAILAVLQILRGGLTYMLSDSVTNKKEARDTIVMALVGLLLVLSPTIVFGIIDPRILSLQVDFSPIRPSTGTGSTPGAPGQPQTGGPADPQTGEPSEPTTGDSQDGCATGEIEVFNSDGTTDCEPATATEPGTPVTGTTRFSVNIEDDAGFVYSVPGTTTGGSCNYYVVNSYSGFATLQQTAAQDAMAKCQAGKTNLPSSASLRHDCTTDSPVTFEVPNPACNQPGLVQQGS